MRDELDESTKKQLRKAKMEKRRAKLEAISDNIPDEVMNKT